MQNKYIVSIIVIFLFFSCGKKEKGEIPIQSVKVVSVQPKSVPIYKEFVGQIYGERDIPIRARVEGFLEEIHFDEGGRVTKGQLLYVVDPDPYRQEVVAQQSAVSQSETLLVQKESDYQRIKPLAEIDAVSQRELDMAQAERDASISGLEASKANLKLAEINLGYANIYAPMDGTIGKTLAREGEFVGRDPNPVILNTISEVKNIRVQFFLSENEYLLMAREYLDTPERENDEAELELILSDGSLYGYKGKIDFIDRNIDASTGAILLQATFPNPDKLIRPGQFARVKVMVKTEENAMLIPQKCVTELQGQYSVLIVNSENKVKAIQVKTGEKIGDMWIIDEGLNKGDKLILEGLQKVSSGMDVIPEITEFKSKTNL